MEDHSLRLEVSSFCSHVYAPCALDLSKRVFVCEDSNNIVFIMLEEKIRQFLEDEARSCSMDFGCVTPEYVYRMWGGSVAIDEIKEGLKEIRKG